MNDDEILGKAYDARLMRRLLTYLRPYWRQVLLAFVAIIAARRRQLAQPYLIKVAIDQHIATRPARAGSTRSRCCIWRSLVAGFAFEYVQTWTMQLTASGSCSTCGWRSTRHLQRLDLRYYDRNPVGRLMTRVTSDVDALNDLFTSGVVTIFGDVFTLLGIMGDDALDELAAGAGRVLRAAADRPGHAVVPAQRARVLPHGARLDRADQRVSAGEHHRDVDGAAVPPRAR